MTWLLNPEKFLSLKEEESTVEKKITKINEGGV